MRIVIIATGLWGDVRPNVVLGQALQKAGYEVLVVATAPYRTWIEAQGLPYAGVSLDMQGMLDLVLGGEGGLLHAVQALNKVRKNIIPTFLQAGKEVAAVMREGDVLLADELVSFLLNGVVEKYLPRLMHVNMQPQAITGQFPATGQPILPDWMPMRSTYNRMSYGFFRHTTWLMQGSVGNKIRAAHLGLPKQTWAKQKILLDSTPSLVLVSRHVVPPPPDWPPHHYVTGYLFDDESDWQAPPNLLDFFSVRRKAGVYRLLHYAHTKTRSHNRGDPGSCAAQRQACDFAWRLGRLLLDDYSQGRVYVEIRAASLAISARCCGGTSWWGGHGSGGFAGGIAICQCAVLP